MEGNIRYAFLTAVDEATKNLALAARKIPRRVTDLPLETSSLRYNGDEYVQAVEVRKNKNMICIRVIMDVYGYDQGVNVLIPCTSEIMEAKYLDLRDLIRNSCRIMVTFQCLTVTAKNGQLVVNALDFKVRSPQELSGRPTILI